MRRRPAALVRPAIAALVFCCTGAIPSMSAAGLVWPDVPERIERGLSSPDPTTRRVAARDLASMGGAKGSPLVLKALGDSDVEVRLAAAEAANRLRVTPAADIAILWLGERDARLRVAACEMARAMPSVHAVQPLARALGDSDPQVRSSCADALGASGSPDAVAPLSGKLDDPTPNVRSQVARALARVGDGRAVVPLVGKVQDSVPDVRQAVVRALGELGDRRATQALLLALRDTVPEVKVEALAALGRLRAPDAVDAIAPLAMERAPGVRHAALVSLGRIATAAAVRALVSALGTQEDATGSLERTPVRDALVAAGAPSIGELTALLGRPVSAVVASSAAWILGELRATSSAPAIVTALRKGRLPSAAALRALAGAGTPEEVPVVLEFLGDPSPATREEALRAATALLDPSRPDGRAVEPLAATLRSPRISSRERAAVATLLGRTGAPRAATELVGLVHAKDAGLRLAAIDALGALGATASPSAPRSEQGAAADDVLVPLLADADPSVRLRAAMAVGASGGVQARRALLAKLDGGEEIDRFAVFCALGGLLERHPDDATARRVLEELDIAAGPERDAVIESAGRARVPSVVSALATTAKSSDTNDRRAVASVLAGHGGSAQATSTLRALTGDPDAPVRAEAAFALGSVGDASIIPFLSDLVRGPDVDVATNAAGALARLARRVNPGADKGPSPVAEAACAMLRDGRATVRANALVALAGAGRRCGDGRTERKLLADDASDLVRGGAARALAASPRPDDLGALDRCAATDRSADVARLCRPRARERSAPTRTHSVTVFVVGESGTERPRPLAPFLLQYEDGVVRAGVADRRGATFDPLAPAGHVTLRRAGP